MTHWPLVPLESTSDGFTLVVGEEGGAADFLFGGWALGLLAQAAERVAGQPVTDLAATFLAPIAIGRRLDVRCTRLAAGRELRYDRIDVSDGDRLVLTGTAVTGPPPGDVTHAITAPTVPDPDDCPPRTYSTPGGQPAVATLLEVRVAEERFGDGLASTARLWARLRVDTSDAVRLAVFSDHVPYLVRRALTDSRRAVTVTGSVRVTGGPATEWVLLDVSLQTHGGRVVTGRCNLWSTEGRLVAVAEQTNRLSY